MARLFGTYRNMPIVVWPDGGHMDPDAIEPDAIAEQ